MRTAPQTTHLPNALPNPPVAWVAVTQSQPAPAAPAKPSPTGLHPAIAAAGILATAIAIYLGVNAGVDTARAARLSHLETENATLRAQTNVAKSAKAAYCQGGAQ